MVNPLLAIPALGILHTGLQLTGLWAGLRVVQTITIETFNYVQAAVHKVRDSLLSAVGVGGDSLKQIDLTSWTDEDAWLRSTFARPLRQGLIAVRERLRGQIKRLYADAKKDPEGFHRASVEAASHIKHAEEPSHDGAVKAEEAMTTQIKAIADTMHEVFEEGGLPSNTLIRLCTVLLLGVGAFYSDETKNKTIQAAAAVPKGIAGLLVELMGEGHFYEIENSKVALVQFAFAVELLCHLFKKHGWAPVAHFVQLVVEFCKEIMPPTMLFSADILSRLGAVYVVLMVLTAWLMIYLKKLQDKLPDTLKKLFLTEGAVGAASSAVGAARPQSS
jgi:hypothetical protein